MLAGLASCGALALVGCSGGDEPSKPAGKTATPTPTADATRDVVAGVGGRELSGHCRGKQGDKPPVVLEHGFGGTQTQFATLEEQLGRTTVVCAYDRAGAGVSDPPATLPRPLSEAVSHLDAFIAAAKLEPPVVVVGHSAGATVAMAYAQAHPGKVGGFVSMNPVPPRQPFLALAKKVETKDEYAEELAFYRGENDERMSFHTSGRLLTAKLPDDMPYAIMFDEDCGGTRSSAAASCQRCAGSRRRWPRSARAGGSYRPATPVTTSIRTLRSWC
jgi:pimeloyl-ACP methyl ester carboxylesterase